MKGWSPSSPRSASSLGTARRHATGGYLDGNIGPAAQPQGHPTRQA